MTGAGGAEAEGDGLGLCRAAPVPAGDSGVPAGVDSAVTVCDGAIFEGMVGGGDDAQDTAKNRVATSNRKRGIFESLFRRHPEDE